MPKVEEKHSFGDGRASAAREPDLRSEKRFVSCDYADKILLPLELERTTHSNVARDPLCPV